MIVGVLYDEARGSTVVVVCRLGSSGEPFSEQDRLVDKAIVGQLWQSGERSKTAVGPWAAGCMSPGVKKQTYTRHREEYLRGLIIPLP